MINLETVAVGISDFLESCDNGAYGQFEWMTNTLYKKPLVCISEHL